MNRTWPPTGTVTMITVPSPAPQPPTSTIRGKPGCDAGQAFNRCTIALSKAVARGSSSDGAEPAIVRSTFCCS
jgi:hypothetical protein